MRWCALALLMLAGCVESARVLGPDDAGTTPPEIDAQVPREDGRMPMPGVSDVSAGGAHSCAIVGGSLWCWGDGTEGALGTGPSGDRLVPARVGAASDWRAIEAGQGMTCGMRESSVWCWGTNELGQLGLGDREPRRSPAEVPLPGAPLVVRASREFVCAIIEGGELLCWGANVEGQLARADGYPGPDGLTPQRVASELRFRDVCTGQGHGCAIATDGSLWCWGRNTESQLGLGTGVPLQLREPTRVGTEVDWAELACGMSHTCAIERDGTLWCWGADFAGQIGITRGSQFDVPTRIDAGWSEIATYVFHTCGVKDDGSLWCWGRNAEGQLGVGDIDDRNRPTRVDDRTDWARVSVGWFHTCAQRTDGSVWCTGENGDGRLGVGDPERRNVFTEVQGIGVE
ncbi:RCC1 domain-containing protein [Sandaracinus amylolyticus]|uniref:RCC1 domain-containing protein n=1 Tax=Sandaracinus amylolyticus TaxID=927083 RepID=UPI001F1C1B84|nr:RCC1 domain-containing protein [Sandaracinus amylolyticus]UJR80081.1 Alpha-tubulin suppressor [Sandaracinus amylolyticus]